MILHPACVYHQIQMEQVSKQYQEFWKIRGSNPDNFRSERFPATEEEIKKAEDLTGVLLAILDNSDLEVLSRNVGACAAQLKREGKITQEQHMEIVQRDEIVKQGETTESFIKGLENR